ncbi:unnamed protein product [Camellia sinensis]
MGALGKWLKSSIGLKKTQSSHQENVGSTGKGRKWRLWRSDKADHVVVSDSSSFGVDDVISAAVATVVRATAKEFMVVRQEWVAMFRAFLRTYYAAVIENCTDFVGRVGVDVGAGSSILSLFAAHVTPRKLGKAGAKHVYAVEASEMAKYARKLIAGNPLLAQRITVVKGKVEEVELPEKADILISEPMGTLLVNERMLETYVIARDRFLVPNGRMFPTIGR